MADARRSSGTGGEMAKNPPRLGGEFVGINDQKVNKNPDQYFGELFRGAHFRKLNRESSYPAGGSFRVSGVVHFDAPTVQLTTRGMRVRVTSPQLSDDIIERFSNIQHCNSRRFSLSVPVPDAPGSRFSYTVKAESTKLGGGWRTDSQEGPFNVQIQTDAGAAITKGFGLVPWAAVGGGIGVAGNRIIDTGYGDYTAGAAGAAAGLVYREYAPPVSLGGLVPDVSDTQLALIAASTFGAAFLLQSSGLSEVLQPTGEVAGSAISASADVARRGAGAARQRLSSPR